MIFIVRWIIELTLIENWCCYEPDCQGWVSWERFEHWWLSRRKKPVVYLIAERRSYQPDDLNFVRDEDYWDRHHRQETLALIGTPIHHVSILFYLAVTRDMAVKQPVLRHRRDKEHWDNGQGRRPDFAGANNNVDETLAISLNVRNSHIYIPLPGPVETNFYYQSINIHKVNQSRWSW